MEDSPGGPRSARGPKGATSEDDEMPPGAKGADFKTLQEMIARGIQDAESGASKLESTLKLNDDEADLRRHREMMRKRREDEAASKQRERDAARERRRREDEERRRRQSEQLEEEFGREQREREQQQELEQQCRKELRAASRIQAHVRGRRSRAGAHLVSPVAKAQLHSKPWAQR